ncbi:MAG: hypothetical protein EXQ80_01840 [Candidatus Nanopelagicaceae bacterium]|nr:hypothetical protein [Candidatus Nanopelagicaceae bacterium]
MSLKKVAITVLTASLLISLQSPALGEVAKPIDEQWKRTAASKPGQYGILIQQSLELLRFSSYLISLDGSKDKVESVIACKSFTDPLCAKTVVQQMSANLQLCSEKITSECVTGMSARNAAGKELKVNYEGPIESSLIYDFAGDATKGLPTGGPPLIFSIPEAPHAGGDKYMLKVEMQGSGNGSVLVIGRTRAGIFPVLITSGKFSPSKISIDTPTYTSYNMINGDSIDPACQFATATKCLTIQTFPEGVAFGFNAKFKNQLTGWWHGRFSTPEITSEIKDGLMNFSIIANPIKVPTVFGWVDTASLPEDLKLRYSKPPRYGSGYFGPINGDLSQTSVLNDTNSVFTDDTLAELKSWLPLLGDRAAAMPSAWAISTIDGDAKGDVERCTKLESGIAGLVTTNASMYSSGPPVFNTESQSLEYKVAAPHLTSTGENLLGSYDLVMNSQVARCMYGFSKAPLKASISVISTSEKTTVETSFLNENNGFIKLSANGFQYSQPTIRVKLTQEKIVEPVVTTTTVAEPVKEAVAKKVVKKIVKTITCTKGKLTRKLSGTAPKCPVGYRAR